MAQGYSMQQAPTEDDLAAALAACMSQRSSRESPPTKTPPSTFNSSSTPPSTIRSGLTGSPGTQTDSIASVPPEIWRRVNHSPALSNLLRTLAHHRRVAATSLLSQAEALQNQQMVTDTQDALRCLLNIP